VDEIREIFTQYEVDEVEATVLHEAVSVLAVRSGLDVGIRRRFGSTDGRRAEFEDEVPVFSGSIGPKQFEEPLSPALLAERAAPRSPPGGKSAVVPPPAVAEPTELSATDLAIEILPPDPNGVAKSSAEPQSGEHAPSVPHADIICSPAADLPGNSIPGMAQGSVQENMVSSELEPSHGLFGVCGADCRADLGFCAPGRAVVSASANPATARASDALRNEVFLVENSMQDPSLALSGDFDSGSVWSSTQQ
jgi:hypothetical protein